MNILGIIPARGGSKGIKGKNTMDIFGKPVFGYTIESALESNLLNKIAVSSDSDEILSVVNDLYNIDLIKRPDEFAKDDSPIEEALLHAVEYLIENLNYHTDIVVWMQPNVPIRKDGLNDEVIEKLINTPNADSCVTCYHAHEISVAMKTLNPDGSLSPVYKDVNGTRRQEFPVRYLLDGSVVALKVKNLTDTRGIRKGHIYLGDKILPVMQNKRMYSIELDEPEDIPLLKYYMKRYLTEQEDFGTG